MLVVKGLEVTYGGVAEGLRGVDLTVEDGQLVTVLGSNGAGKTTLLRAISNVLNAFNGVVTGGSIDWDGLNLVRTRADRIVGRGLIQAPEGRGIFGRLTVEENLRVGGFLRSRADQKTQQDHVLELFPDLSGRLREHAGLLSGGQQQMLAIGRALMANPKVLLLDEPSLGLAPKIVDDVADVVRRINQEGTTVVLVEQNASMALSMADYAYVLENGRVSLHGPGPELRDSDEVRRLYLGQGAEEALDAAAVAGQGLGDGTKEQA
ncbi:ABC transporter ATP-binding protein [Nocardioides sp. Y6]|uniref:ABC transporter ATP-binding protein n=1 Tax=Nocardioides malaquae TaxID=2773426 RepID=A0ABR9RUD9_9ACTN|nr:ABC transporter ATP-binding protein [Nocardioides malaquae]